jgi:hypothetical protein
MEAGEFVVLYGKADFDWFTANLTIFDVGLAADRQVQHHRNFFTTIGTGECVFHRRRRYCMPSGRTTKAADRQSEGEKGKPRTKYHRTGPHDPRNLGISSIGPGKIGWHDKVYDWHDHQNAPPTWFATRLRDSHPHQYYDDDVHDGD